MLLDANVDADVPAELSSELVIVGAGTVGLFLAEVLAGLGERRDVILVEAGSKVPGTASNAARSTSVGRPHEGVHLGRAAGLGGTSSLWGGQLAEFSPADLEREDAAWPLTYEELRGHYRDVYRILGIGNPESAAFYREKLGAETEGAEPIERFFTYWLKQPNFATLFKKQIQAAPSLRVLVNLTANGCEFDGDRARVLRCKSAGGRNITIRSGHFIFASGTIETNRFFLSTKRTGSVPWMSSDRIGLYFQDHFGGRIAKGSVLDEKRFRDYFENGWVNGIKLQPKLTLSSIRRRSLPSGACGFFTFDSSVGENVANLKQTIRGLGSALTFSSARSRAADLVAVGRSIIPIASRYMRRRRILALFDQGLHFNVQAEQIPIAGSRIRLIDAAPAADGLVPVAVDWKCDGRELAAIYELAVESDAYLRRRGLAELTLDPALRRRDSSFIDRLGDTYHQCGGMRMSTSPREGVVDADCRVWGTRNVWIAGASVLPSSSHANCTLTALAMAARLAARLH